METHLGTRLHYTPLAYVPLRVCSINVYQRSPLAMACSNFERACVQAFYYNRATVSIGKHNGLGGGGGGWRLSVVVQMSGQSEKKRK